MNIKNDNNIWEKIKLADYTKEEFNRGWNPKFKLIDKSNKTYIVKGVNDKFLKNEKKTRILDEYLSNFIMKELGFSVPDVKLVTLDGEYYFQSKMIDNCKDLKLPKDWNEITNKDEILTSILIYPLISNQDIIKRTGENYVIDANGKGYNVDLGSCFSFNQKGDFQSDDVKDYILNTDEFKKNYTKYTNAFNDIQSKEKIGIINTTFADKIEPKHIKEALVKLEKLNFDTLRNMINSLSYDKKTQELYIDSLKKRHKSLIKELNNLLLKYQVIYTSGNFNSANTGLKDYCDTMNKLEITNSNKYKIYNNPGLNNNLLTDFNKDNGKKITLFHEVKHPHYAFGNNIKNNIEPFLKKSDFIFFTTEKDRNTAIKEIPELSLKSSAVPVPITLNFKNNPSKKTESNVMWFGMIKDFYKGINDALDLAKKFQENKINKKVIFAGSAIPRDIKEVKNLIQKAYANFTSNAADITSLKKDYTEFLNKNKNEPNIPIEIHLDVTPQELDELCSKCSYLYKPEAKGFCDSNSSAINLMSRGLILLSQVGYCTDKDYKEGGVYKDAIKLGRKYDNLKKESKLETRLKAQEAFDIIDNLEKNPKEKDKIIKASQNLINNRFLPKKIKQLVELNLNHISNENFNNSKLQQESEVRKKFHLREKEKYKKPERANFVIREKMIAIKNIIHNLMSEIDLGYTDIGQVFELAKKYEGFTNKLENIKKEITDNNKLEKMKKFSKLFQYYCNNNDILSPKSINGKKEVGLRTKRVLGLFGDKDTLLEFLQQNTTQLTLDK